MRKSVSFLRTAAYDQTCASVRASRYGQWRSLEIGHELAQIAPALRQ